MWSQGVRKLPHVVGDRLLNVLGIGPSHKTRRSLGASQTWGCSRIAAITKWACSMSDVSIEKVSMCGKGESVKRVRAKLPAVSDASHAGHLVNQSIPIHHNLAFRECDFAGKRRVQEQMPLVHTC